MNRWLCITALVAAACPLDAAAQMYKCTGADGKTSFSDRPCVTPGAKQETRAATLAEKAKRIGVSESVLREIEDKCQEGYLGMCQMIEDIRTPAPQVSDAELLRRWNMDATMLEAMRKDCRTGNGWVCLRLERIKRTTPERERKEQQEMLTKMCARGNKGACAEVDDPNRAAREAAEERAAARKRAMADQSELCQKGDRAACERLERLKNNR
jgi:hypothetical protein